jgi:hypothetical protein
MPRTHNSTPLTLTEKETINALSASGKTPHAIGVELRRSPHTVKRHLQCPEAQQRVNTIKRELADLFEELSRRMIESITEKDIQKINAYQRTVAAGISTDKMRLLRNLSTQNLDISAALEEAEAEERVLNARIKELEVEIANEE